LPSPGAGYDQRCTSPTPRGSSMKKLLILLILVAIGVAVAKKVREA
jgi:hypothetical protein